MARPSDVMKPERFAGKNFKRWKTRVKVLAHAHELVVGDMFPRLRGSSRSNKNVSGRSSNMTICCLLSLPTKQLCDIYMNYATPSLVWEAPDRKYGELDAGCELYVNETLSLFQDGR